MIPYRYNCHLTFGESHFNTVLSSLRQTVVRAIRLLKGWWWKLQHMDHMDSKLLVKLVMCLCILHNVCFLHADFDSGYTLDNHNDGGDKDNDSDSDSDGCSGSPLVD